MNKEITSLVTTFPYKEDFENFGASPGSATQRVNNGWNQDDDDGIGYDANWFFGTETPSSTGPDTNGLGDRTSGTGRFGYIEDSSNQYSAINLRSPYFDLDTLTQPTMRVFVNSHDYSNAGHFNPLAIDVLTPSGVVLAIASVSQDTGDVWQPLIADLTPYIGQLIRIQIRGRNDTSSSHWCDTAIDDFQVVDAASSSVVGQAPQLGAATFDINNATNVWGDTVEQGPFLNGPYEATVAPDSSALFSMNGMPGQGILMFSGPLNPRVATFPGFGQFDVGALPLNSNGIPKNLTTEADGISTPVTGLNKIFITNSNGQSVFFASIPNLPVGTFASFQCIFLEPVKIIAFSNAVTLTIM